MRMAFGSLIAVILLALYVYLVKSGIAVIDCKSTGCTLPSGADFNEQMQSAVSLIAGLVSALVISELAITVPGQAPVARALDANASVNTTRFVTVVAFIYLLVWLGTGLWAFLVGLKHPDFVPAITDLGKSWFGLAIAAAYAYFGITPK
jgi:hypothetical protein